MQLATLPLNARLFSVILDKETTHWDNRVISRPAVEISEPPNLKSTAPSSRASLRKRLTGVLARPFTPRMLPKLSAIPIRLRVPQAKSGSPSVVTLFAFISRTVIDNSMFCSGSYTR